MASGEGEGKAGGRQCASLCPSADGLQEEECPWASILASLRLAVPETALVSSHPHTGQEPPSQAGHHLCNPGRREVLSLLRCLPRVRGPWPRFPGGDCAFAGRSQRRLPGGRGGHGPGHPLQPVGGWVWGGGTGQHAEALERCGPVMHLQSQAAGTLGESLVPPRHPQVTSWSS